MQRVCFRLRVKPERLAEYKRRHAAVWPEMLAALRDAGWHDYSLFLHDDGLLVGYFRTPDLTAALAAMEQTEVNQRWQAEMAPFFESLDGRRPDQGFEVLEEIFNLADQLTNEPERHQP
ncbi:L-rhamnose mutarotase [Natronosporangium hydrolyticum]|uniref:L-rhamnose mutarotase n=1 Tax=Natronosporangium hydrolyticum TaxID=2811111 RepID=A0A895YFR6_9ACTN|nr:L-rhamnose mutarotase [Natronosporangium hydrolyticum]QSB13386.1 L-rhamnose mutarotase [Natronosporangium hydrolyticum]